jgi:hypothetical protein
MVPPKRKNPNRIRTLTALRINKTKHVHRHSRTKLAPNKTCHKANKHPPKKTAENPIRKTPTNRCTPKKRKHNRGLSQQPGNHPRTNPTRGLRRRIQFHTKRQRSLRRHTLHANSHKRKIHMHINAMAHRQHILANMARNSLQRLRKKPRHLPTSHRTQRSIKTGNPTKN